MKPPKRLRPLRPNEALRIAYQRKIDRLIREMNVSVSHWVEMAYRSNKPVIAMDDVLPSNALKRVIAKLKKRWLKRFDRAAIQLSEYFSLAAQDRNDKALAKIFRDGGFSVRFQQSQAMKDIVAATIQQNVALIKSIPQKYLSDVRGPCDAFDRGRARSRNVVEGAAEELWRHAEASGIHRAVSEQPCQCEHEPR